MRWRSRVSARTSGGCCGAAVWELATGQPVEPERLAALADLPLDQTLAVAREAWEWDLSAERLVGAGLTSIPRRDQVGL